MKKICIAIISIALIIAFGISLNNVEKTELQSTDGRDFEKATVTEIVSSDYSDSTSKDYDGSVGEDGSVRAGQQQIKVKIRTGEHKGEILDAIQEELQQKGFLAKLQDYEPVDFWGGQE